MFRKNRKLKYKARQKLPRHKRLFLHPLIIFIYMSVGVVLLFATVRASAVSIGITAKIPAPAITSPAVIEIVAPASDPTDGMPAQNADTPETALVVKTKQVVLTGECPKNSHLEFYRNNTFAGVAPCIGDPTFSITIDLVEGLNAIIVRDFNITNDQGPVSRTIYIRYSPAVATLPSQAPSTFLVRSDYRFLGFYTGERGSWKIDIQGGKAPYSLHINWGDGDTENITRADDTSFSISHSYAKASGRTGYVITISATDAAGSTSVFQLMAIASDKGTHQAGVVNAANAELSPSVIKLISNWLWVIWPAYILLSLMLFSFWLGERQEYVKLRDRYRRRRGR